MALPTEKTKPKTDMLDLVTLMYGPPKIGKSTFCSKADGALFLATEPGLESLSVYQQPVMDWASFLSTCTEIAKGEHQFRTIIIDTIDNLYRTCVDYILKKNNMQHQSDMEYGKGYDLVNGEFQRRLTALSLLPYGLMMVSHSVEKEVKTRTGKEYKIYPTLPNSARKIVLGMADFILYAEQQEIRDDHGVITGYERIVHTQPTTLYEAGNRCQFVIPDPLPLDYTAFTAALEMAAKKGGSAEIQTAAVAASDSKTQSPLPSPSTPNKK